MLITLAYENYENFLEQLKLKSDCIDMDFSLNDNPRCFLTIEVENTTSVKHKLGSIINASALGKIGIVVGYSEGAYKTLTRIRKYLDLLKSVGKISYSSDNVIIIKRRDFISELIRARGMSCR